MCHIGVSDQGRSSSTVVQSSNDCKWVFNEASLTPWFHGVVHSEVKMSRFSACFPDIAGLGHAVFEWVQGPDCACLGSSPGDVTNNPQPAMFSWDAKPHTPPILTRP